MPDWDAAIARYLEIWNGLRGVDELDGIVASNYRGHMGSRERDARQLKEDIVSYRERADDVRFEVVHRFSDGDYVATRIVAHATDAVTGTPLFACGLNISHWQEGRLVEEWAVWEPLAASSSS